LQYHSGAPAATSGEATNFMTLFPPNFQIEIRATVFGNLAAREGAPVEMGV